ncbi:MAG: hypothetical protein CMJ18_05230 [Phycisphaeraceae bacterium]|nr:hypothetical protein [Phycisphaeraceae bacterium]
MRWSWRGLGAGVVTLPALVLGVGFIFHTSREAAMIGKYSPGYFAFLCAWFLLVTPCVLFLARWIFRTQPIRFPSGRIVQVRPLPKILVIAVLLVIFARAVDRTIEKQIARSTTTRSDRFHPYLQNTPKAGRKRHFTNQWGFRGEAIEREKPAGAFRIFMFGGSTVFCGRMPVEDSHPYLLRQRLQAARPDVTVEVQNVGADWHTTQHSLMKYLFKVRAFSPDLVVIYHGINDLSRSFTPDLFGQGRYQEDYAHYHGAATHLVRPEQTKWKMVRMRLGYWFSDFLQEQVHIIYPDAKDGARSTSMFFPRARPVAVTEWPSLGAFERNLRDFARLVQSEGTTLVIASQPSIYRPDLKEHEQRRLWIPLAQQQDGTRADLPSMIEGMRRFNDVSRRVATEAGAVFVNLDALVPKTTEHFVDDVHYTRAACDLIADAFASRIGPRIRNQESGIKN